MITLKPDPIVAKASPAPKKSRAVPAEVAEAVREIEGEVRFVQSLPIETVLGLERKRKERGLRSRAETIRVLLKEAVNG